MVTLLYSLIGIIKGILSDPNKPIYISQTTNYLNLFKAEYRDSLKLQKSIFSANRDTISFLNFSDKYNIQITKLLVKESFIIPSDIVELDQMSKMEAGFFYPFYEKDFTIYYKDSQFKSASKIYLTKRGDSIKIFHINRNSIGYYLNIESLCIKYKKNEDYDILLKSKNKLPLVSNKIPIIFFFVKKDNVIYFILFSALNNSIELDTNLISNLINSSN